MRSNALLVQAFQLEKNLEREARTLTLVEKRELWQEISKRFDSMMFELCVEDMAMEAK